MAGENTDYLALEERFAAIEKQVGELDEKLDPAKLAEAIAKALPGGEPGKTDEPDEGDEVTAESVAKTVDEKIAPVTEAIAKVTGMVEALGRGSTGQPVDLSKSPNGDAEHAGIL